jgi:hypothetical protein
MNIDDWQYYYKLMSDGSSCESNLLYTPLINFKKTIMCMHYFQDLNYQYKKTIPNDVTKFFFDREVFYINKLQNFNFVPKVYEIDYTNQKIFIEFPGETLSQIVYGSRSIDNECPDWKEQIYNILKTLRDAGYYKMALYPHCFFIDSNKRIKTIDYYSIIPANDIYINRSMIEPMIGKNGAYRFDRSTNDGKINFREFLKITMTEHLNGMWPEDLFARWYGELYND